MKTHVAKKKKKRSLRGIIWLFDSITGVQIGTEEIKLNSVL